MPERLDVMFKVRAHAAAIRVLAEQEASLSDLLHILLELGSLRFVVENLDRYRRNLEEDR